MSTVNRKSFLQAQVLEMDRLIELSKGDPLMGSGLSARKSELEKELHAMPAKTPNARTRLYFAGEPVNGSYGIDAEFAAKAIAPFVDMVKTQFVAEKHGRVASRGRVPEQREARLLLTGLPRGSVGIEFSPPPAADLFAEGQLAGVLNRLAKTLSAAGDSDEGFAQSLEGVSSRAFQRLRDFLGVVAAHRASLRFETTEQTFDLDQARVAQASSRASNTQTAEQVIEKPGVFRGATLESGRFDFRTEDGDVLSGWIAETVTDDTASQMNALTNQPAVAQLRETTFTTPEGQSRIRWELLGLTTPA